MKKKFKKELDKYTIWILTGTVLPFIMYLFIFGANGVSFKNANWSDFGGFIGGYATLIFGAGNLYFLIKVAYTINHLDEKRNKKNKIDSIKPLGLINKKLSIIKKYYIIRLDNFGSGPLLINNITINYKDKDYQNFRSLTNDIIYNLNITPILYGETNNKIAIGSNKSYELIKITFDEKCNFPLTTENIQDKFNLIIKELDSAILNFECTDLLGNNVELFIK